MSDYTPTTEEVRRGYAWENKFSDRGEFRAAFDRWLAERDARVRGIALAEAAQAYDAAEGRAQGRPCHLPHNSPPCTTCRCGADVTWEEAIRRTIAAVEAEEPEGEVEYRVFDWEGELWASTNSLDEARHYLAQDPDGYARIERAVWVPVEGDGDSA